MRGEASVASLGRHVESEPPRDLDRRLPQAKEVMTARPGEAAAAHPPLISSCGNTFHRSIFAQRQTQASFKLHYSLIPSISWNTFPLSPPQPRFHSQHGALRPRRAHQAALSTYLVLLQGLGRALEQPRCLCDQGECMTTNATRCDTGEKTAKHSHPLPSLSYRLKMRPSSAETSSQ